MFFQGEGYVKAQLEWTRKEDISPNDARQIAVEVVLAWEGERVNRAFDDGVDRRGSPEGHRVKVGRLKSKTEGSPILALEVSREGRNGRAGRAEKSRVRA